MNDRENDVSLAMNVIYKTLERVNMNMTVIKIKEKKLLALAFIDNKTDIAYVIGKKENNDFTLVKIEKDKYELFTQ